LNTAEFEFDDGDCCESTCVISATTLVARKLLGTVTMATSSVSRVERRASGSRDFPAGKGDYVNDICVLGSFLFVVGTTEGFAEGIHKSGAFVVKINLKEDNTSEIIWQRQISGTTVTGLACAVSPLTLFVGGTGG
jgi:hypothetical protein